MADDPEWLRAEIARDNPRRPGEPLEDWEERLDAIRERAARRYVNDVRAIAERTGTDWDEARDLYSDALSQIGETRNYTDREEVVDVAEAIHKARQVPGKRKLGDIWTGEVVWHELLDQYGHVVDAALSELRGEGEQSFEADLFAVFRGSVIGEATVSWDADLTDLGDRTETPEWWASYHDEARDWAEQIGASRRQRGRSPVVVFVSAIRHV